MIEYYLRDKVEQLSSGIATGQEEQILRLERNRRMAALINDMYDQIDIATKKLKQDLTCQVVSLANKYI